jgi:hypothetical protein
MQRQVGGDASTQSCRLGVARLPPRDPPSPGCRSKRGQLERPTRRRQPRPSRHRPAVAAANRLFAATTDCGGDRRLRSMEAWHARWTIGTPTSPGSPVTVASAPRGSAQCIGSPVEPSPIWSLPTRCSCCRRPVRTFSATWLTGTTPVAAV